jgi:hypothetical protein
VVIGECLAMPPIKTFWKVFKMLIDELKVTQSGIRDTDQLLEMIKFVKEGGIFTPEVLEKNYKGVSVPKKIAISIFPDGEKFIHDGHTRTLAIYLGGRHELHEEEFIKQNWLYEDYLTSSIDAGWVTPFDPRKEVRLPDFFEFKNEALSAESFFTYYAFIKENRHRYCLPREVNHIADLTPWVWA